MKLPSIKVLTEGFVKTIKRFPFETLFAAIGTTAAIVKTLQRDEYYDQSNEWYTRIMMMANLGLLLSLAVSLYTRSKDITGAKRLIIKFGAALVAWGLLFLLNPEERSQDYFRFFLLSLALHLIVSFIAFIGTADIQGFWQFNKTIFLRFLTSVLYSGVLFLGLAAALGAASFLFNLKLEWRTYMNLWYFIGGIFNTLFFLAGVPEDTKVLGEDESYPKGLKIFTQYVLIPLATIYLLILLAYEVKLIGEWSLPKGLVSNLILGYAVFGILSILLIYPIREQEGNKWIKTYSKSFYFLLIPLLVLLFLALGRRVFTYGITEERYFLMILAFWLLFITGYFLTSHKQNIKIIPVSLAILALLSVYGPQSAFSVSTYSQLSGLVDFFKKHHAFTNDKFSVIKEKVTKKEADKALGKLRYLVNDKGLETLQPYVTIDLKKVKDSLAKTITEDRFMYRYELRSSELTWAEKRFGMEKMGTLSDIYSVHQTLFISAIDEDITDIKGYDYMLSVVEYAQPSIRTIGGLHVEQKFSADKDTCSVTVNKEHIDFNIRAFADSLNKALLKEHQQSTGNQIKLPREKLTLTKQSQHYVITLLINNFNVGEEDDANRFNGFNGWCLIKVK